THLSKEYVIGCSSPLTGDGANYGRSVKEGVELALQEINEEKFLDSPLTIIFEDDKMDPREGVNAITKLINVDKVPVIIGPFGSSIVLSTSPIAEKNKTIIISASATADDIKDAGDFIFRITPPNSKQGSDIASFCYDKLNCKTAAVLFQNNDYGITLKNSFENTFTELGGKITSSDGVILNTSNLSTQLLSIKGNKPDVVFFPLHYKESGLMLKQAKEIGLNSYFISADGAMTEDMLKIAGNSAEGSFYSTLALGYGKADDEIKDFENLFYKKFAKEPDIYNAYYYEVTWIVANALKNAGTDSEKIKNYLYSLSGDNCYYGITGETCFDKNGEVDKAFYIYEVIKGKYELSEKN
ncbi:MAG: ABC transporter substrate-binding protein, partial [Pelagibacterales bacterium]|nr:ABC transporter substrate-binding protein [Pelagibacterales bacterium]